MTNHPPTPIWSEFPANRHSAGPAALREAAASVSPEAQRLLLMLDPTAQREAAAAAAAYLLYRYTGSAAVTVGMSPPAFHAGLPNRAVGIAPSRCIWTMVEFDGEETAGRLLELIRLSAAATREAALVSGPFQTAGTVATWGLEHAEAAMSLLLVPGDNGFSASVRYDAARYSDAFIHRLMRQWIETVVYLAVQPERPLAQLDWLTSGDREAMETRYAETVAAFPQEATVHGLFEAQCGRTPKRAAYVDETVTLTYAELDRRANLLARLLQTRGAGLGSIIAIAAERSSEMLIGILGILKSGGAYMPVDPGFPEDRISYMLAHSGAKLLLTQSRFADSRFTAAGAARIELDQLDWRSAADSDTDSPVLLFPAKPDDLAYVIYTSGSTGKPKGVMIEHRSVVNRLHWMQKRYPIGAGDVILQKTPFTFDVSVWELFWWGWYGATACFLRPGGEKDPREIIRAIEAFGVTTLHFVPSMLNLFLKEAEALPDGLPLASLKYVFASGEALQAEQVRRFNRTVHAGTQAVLVNLYGPTEATVDVSYHDCSPGEPGAFVPIGRPIDNTELLVVDSRLRPVPDGVTGELCIGGVGLARGYLNRPDLTEERFVPHPWRAGARLYRTGDLARVLADGSIQYLGRNDFQVKIRGYRIEIGEIEARLLVHPDIAEAAVTVRTDEHGADLCAYIVGSRDLPAEEWRDWLGQTLPAYMIPAWLVRLDEMPLSPNGKLAVRSLPDPLKGMAVRAAYAAPRHETERRIAEAFEQTLGIARVGIHDSFVALGGHSLKAHLLLAAIAVKLGAELSLGDVLRADTPARLAERLAQQGGGGGLLPLTPLATQAAYAVSSAQQRMFTLHAWEGDSRLWNMPAMIRLEGPLDADRFREAVTAVVRRHEPLRTSFHIERTALVQTVHAAEEINGVCDYAEIAESDLAAEALSRIRPFRLEEAPLLRACLLKLSDERHALIIDVHHIVFDGMSIRPLVEDLLALYRGEAPRPLRVHYKDFAAWDARRQAETGWSAAETYWRNAFAGYAAGPPLPADLPRKPDAAPMGAHVRDVWAHPLAGGLASLAQREGTTLYTVLLSVYLVVLARWRGTAEVTVGSFVSGRPAHPDVQRMIGMFANTLPVRGFPHPTKTVRALIGEMKARVLELLDVQQYPYGELIDLLRQEGVLGPGEALFESMFTMQDGEWSAWSKTSANHLRIALEEVDLPICPFDTALQAEEREDGLHFKLSYHAGRFQSVTAELLLHQLRGTAEQIILNPDMLIGDLHMETPSQGTAAPLKNVLEDEVGFMF